MKMYGNRTQSLVLGLKSQLAFIALIAVLMWATGLPTWIGTIKAAQLAFLSDTLSDSDLSAGSTHRMQFTTQTLLDANDTIVIAFDPAGSAFDVGFLGFADFFATSSIRVVGNAVGSCGVAASEVYVSTTSESVTLTVCTGDTVSAGAIAFTMGTTTATKITNPGSSGSRVVRVTTTNDGGATRDTGDTRVFIIDDVTVTASVDSSFTFTITGVANGASVNGSPTTTATTTTATAIQFETLTPNVSKVNAQDLSVTTNAANGFTVTVIQDQNLRSASGADIDNFSNGATTTAPIAWTTPTNTPNQEWTFGHLGITSEDATLSNGDNFGTDLWAGNFDTPREIFYHNAPTNGSTPNEGSTRVGYQVEVDSLQESASDYTNTLTYVATPVF